jgi:lysophospholipase L1-like esterase
MVDFRGIDTEVGWENRRFRDLQRQVDALRSERRIPGSGIDYTVAARATAAAAAAVAAAERAEAALAAATVGATALSPLRAALARHRLNPARVAFYGSSTTAGVGSSEPSNSYVNIIARRLQAAYPSGIAGYEYGVTTPGTLAITSPNVLPGVQVVNGGVGGTVASNYIDGTAMTNIELLRPDCVVHMIGANDYFFDVAPATYQAQLENRLTLIDDAIVGKDTCHVLVHSYRRLDVTTPAYSWSEYGAALRAIAASRDNVFFIDLSAEYQNLGSEGSDPYGLISGDQIHQTDVGHALMADLIYRALTPAPSQPLAPLQLSDTYTRPNGAPVAAETPVGATYTALSGTWAIAGNKLGLTAGGSIAVESGLADLDITAVIEKGAGSPTPGLLFRVSDDSNRLGFFLNPSTGTVQLFRMDAGVNTAIASTAFTFDRTYYVMRVLARGASIRCYVNGTLRLSHTLSGADQTKFGVFTKVGFRSSTAPADLKFWGLTVRRIL